MSIKNMENNINLFIANVKSTNQDISKLEKDIKNFKSLKNIKIDLIKLIFDKGRNDSEATSLAVENIIQAIAHSHYVYSSNVLNKLDSQDFSNQHQNRLTAIQIGHIRYEMNRRNLVWKQNAEDKLSQVKQSKQSAHDDQDDYSKDLFDLSDKSGEKLIQLSKKASNVNDNNPYVILNQARRIAPQMVDDLLIDYGYDVKQNLKSQIGFIDVIDLLNVISSDIQATSNMLMF